MNSGGRGGPWDESWSTAFRRRGPAQAGTPTSQVPPSGGEDRLKPGLQLLKYSLQAERTGSSRDSNFSSIREVAARIAVS